jgi:dolichol-phosphate mannosyltransferase
MKCTAVIPTYNERENIEGLIEQVLGLGPEFHVLIVDDNSPDGTGEIVRRLQEQSERVRVLQRPGKKGLGTAYMDGMTLALAEGADYVVQMDADFSHQPSALVQFLDTAQQTDAEVVIGTRYAQGGAIRNWPLSRKLLSRVGNTYARLLLGREMTDYTSGFMLHRSSALREVPFCEFAGSNFAFLLELKVEYARQGRRAVEVPIEFINRERGTSKISLRIVLEAFRIVLHIYRRHGRLTFAKVALPEPADATLATPEGPQRRLP